MTATTQSSSKMYQVPLNITPSYNEDYWAGVCDSIISQIKSLPKDLQSKILYNKYFLCDGMNYPSSAYDTPKDTVNMFRIPDRSSGIFLTKQYSDTYSWQRYVSNALNMDNLQSGGFEMSDEGILTSYIQAAMKQSEIKKLEDGTVYCEIPSCQGVWANEDTLQECVADLRQTLELWLFLKIKDNDPLPIIGGIDLNKIGSEFIEIDE